MTTHSNTMIAFPQAAQKLAKIPERKSSQSYAPPNSRTKPIRKIDLKLHQLNAPKLGTKTPHSPTVNQTSTAPPPPRVGSGPRYLPHQWRPHTQRVAPAQGATGDCTDTLSCSRGSSRSRRTPHGP